MSSLLSLNTLAVIAFALLQSTCAQPILPEAPAVLTSDVNPTTTTNLGSLYDTAILVAAGTTIESGMYPDFIGRGKDGFKGFDMRPKYRPGATANPEYPIKGFSGTSVWRNETVPLSMSYASDAYEGHAVSGSVSSSSEVSKKVHVDEKVSMGFLGFDAEQTFGYDSMSETTSNFVSSYTYSRAQNPSLILSGMEHLKLVDRAVALLQAGKVDDFFDNYGTHFVKGLTYGCEASAQYQYVCNSQKDTQTINAGLQTGFLGQSVEVKTQIDDLVSSKRCNSTSSWQTSGEPDGLILPNSNDWGNSQVMTKFWSDFNSKCANTIDKLGKLQHIQLGSWLEVPQVYDLVSNNQNMFNVFKFWATMDQASMNVLGQAGRYTALVQKALNRLDEPTCQGALNPWAKTGLFDRNGDIVDSQVASNYWDNLPQRSSDFKAKFAKESRFDTYVNSQTIADAMKNGHTMASLVQTYALNAKNLYHEAVGLYRYAYCGIKSTLHYGQSANNFLITSPANYPAEKGGATGETSDLPLTVTSQPTSVDGKMTNVVLNVWRRITAELSWKTPVPTLKPVLTIEGYFGTSDGEYLCGFSEMMMETEGNYKQSHLEIQPRDMKLGKYGSNSWLGMPCPFATYPIIVDEQVDYVMDDIEYVSY